MQLGTASVLVKAKTDKYEKDISSARRHIEKFGDASVRSVAKGEKAFSGFTKSVVAGTTAIVGLAGAYGLGRLAGSFLDTARNFERLGVQLETILGSSAKAEAAMDWITEFTAKTPYELDQVTAAFVKLEAYGLSGTRWLGTLGDTASSMGKDINQAVEMFADAVTGEFERLKEFGVKASVQGDHVSFRWSQNGKDMVLSSEKTASGISAALEQIFSRFEGGMDKQSRTMDGMLSNLKDQFTLLQKTIMDAGIFDELKIQVEEVVKQFTKWVDENDELIKQRVPEYIEDIKASLETLSLVATPLAVVMKELGPYIKYTPLLFEVVSNAMPSTGLIKLIELYKEINKSRSVQGGDHGEWISKQIVNSGNQYIDSWQLKSQPDNNYSKQLSDVEQQFRDDKVSSSLNSFFSDMEGMEDKLFSDMEDVKKQQLELQERFLDKYNSITLSSFDYERYKVKENFDFWSKTEVDKIKLKEMYDAQMQDITEREAADLKDRLESDLDSFFSDIESLEEGTTSTMVDHLKSLEDATRGVFKEMEDAAMDFLFTGENSISDFVDAALKDLGRLAWQETVTKPLSGWVGGLFGSEHGNVVSGISAYSNQIVSTPTFVPGASRVSAYATGGALFGESGPEGILPLKRMSSGNLGVEASGNRSIVINNTINIESSGGDDVALANRIATTIEHKIRAVIQDEKRVGGSLNNSISGGVI